MKPKDYISKYNLQQGWNSKVQSEFLQDLSSEFLAFCEYYKADQNIKGFDLTVRTIRMKWDAISNKIPYGLPDKLWNYFYASFVVKLREEMFPEEMKRRREEAEERKRRRDERKAEKERERQFFESFHRRQQERFEYAFFAAMFLFGGLSVRPVESYNILGITEDATEDQVKAKYRELCLIHHPDKGGKQEDFVKITEAKNKVLAYISKHP